MDSLSIDTPRDLDEALSLLSHRYRRYCLRYLTTESSKASVSELVRYLRDREVAAEPTQSLAIDQQHVRLRLHHIHLPKLAALGVVAFDSDAGRVADVDANADLLELLDAVEGVQSQ